MKVRTWFRAPTFRIGPTGVRRSIFETSSVGDGRRSFGARFRGYVHPPVTGSYISGSRRMIQRALAESDDQPENKRLMSQARSGAVPYETGGNSRSRNRHRYTSNPGGSPTSKAFTKKVGEAISSPWRGNRRAATWKSSWEWTSRRFSVRIEMEIVALRGTSHEPASRSAGDRARSASARPRHWDERPVRAIRECNGRGSPRSARQSFMVPMRPI